ncbi:MAG TPA: hypothetical protein VG737_15865 [Cyclobacteriaceae bacterium]|nr:hypothetical protein [Cyclobacteriaceae bacterium]
MKGESISVLELRRLLADLKSHSDICIRVRLLGKFWDNSFLQIQSITESGVRLYNPTLHKVVEIQNLQDIVQFEIDKKYQNFQPHNHYDVSWGTDT